MKFRIATVVLMLFGISTSVHASPATDPVVFQSGNWSVLRSTDAMTDKTTCTGIYKDDRSIQLSSEVLYIMVKGGMQSITLRFDEQPADGMRLASKLEKDIDAVIIEGAPYTKMLGSSRLRAQVLTLVSGLATFDLELAGINEAVANILADCPGTPVEETGSSRPTLCSSKVLERMHSRNLSQQDIDFVCSP